VRSVLPLFSVAALLAGSHLTMPAAPLDYPKTPEKPVTEQLHGTTILDPFRWLEDDNSAETKAWVEAQNKVTFGYLEQIPQRGFIRDRMTKLFQFERFSTPYQRGGRYFFSRNSGLQNQNVWYWSKSPDAEPRVLLDPNALSADGTVAVGPMIPSEDGKYVAYQMSRSGSDWQEIRVRDVESGKETTDRVEWVKFSGLSWAKDGSGFYYSRFDAPKEGGSLTAVNEFQKVFFHKLGDAQSSDRLVYQRTDQPKWGFNAGVTDDGRYLIFSVSQGTDTRNRVFYQDLKAAESKVVELLNDFDASYNFIDNDGPIFWFLTDLKAPRSRIIAVDIREPSREKWKEIVPEAAGTLTGVGVVGDRFVAEYLRDARSEVKLFKLDGSPDREIDLPGIGSAGGFVGRRADTETFYNFTSFNVPGRIYRYEFGSGRSLLWKQPKVDFDPDAFETKQVWVTSKDGTRVPMFVTHKKGLKLDGSNPALLYGYGGFNISLTPSFSIGNIVWMEMGGIYAVPNLRGGGEYGESWHKAGTKLQKQNVFDDFIASAEWLIKEGYTNPRKLAISGGSNGGLLVGASMTQRPDLFGACLPAVGVLDMLRFHKFTIGWAWASDYGSAENGEEFKALLAYSPYHNLKPGVAYPPTLITTADHDDRVVPAHSFKFAARAQQYQAGDNPMLIRIETKAGHGAGKPVSKQIEERADQLAFLTRQFSMAAPEVK
jgi:prolyl oligopeptidase